MSDQTKMVAVAKERLTEWQAEMDRLRCRNRVAVGGVAPSLYEECLATSAPVELRPPAEHADKLLHWVTDESGMATVLRYHSGGWDFPWETIGSDERLIHTSGYRYLGPAEWRPGFDALRASIMKAQASQNERDTARIADLETVNAGLRAQLAFKADRLASVEAHNAELVAKYEALKALHYGVPQPIGDAFPANALGRAPKAGPR